MIITQVEEPLCIPFLHECITTRRPTISRLIKILCKTCIKKSNGRLHRVQTYYPKGLLSSNTNSRANSVDINCPITHSSTIILDSSYIETTTFKIYIYIAGYFSNLDLEFISYFFFLNYYLCAFSIHWQVLSLPNHLIGDDTCTKRLCCNTSSAIRAASLCMPPPDCPAIWTCPRYHFSRPLPSALVPLLTVRLQAKRSIAGYHSHLFVCPRTPGIHPFSTALDALHLTLLYTNPTTRLFSLRPYPY